MRFVDTNVFIRFLTADDEGKLAACRRLFERVESGQEVLTACEAIVTEVVYVLASPRTGYGLSREEIRARFIPILSLPGLMIPQKQVYIDALKIYASSSFDFEDAVAVAHMRDRGITEIVSYDRDFDSVSGIQRMEPPMLQEV